MIYIILITYYDSSLVYNTLLLRILLQLNNFHILVELILFFYLFLDTAVITDLLKIDKMNYFFMHL